MMRSMRAWPLVVLLGGCDLVLLEKNAVMLDAPPDGPFDPEACPKAFVAIGMQSSRYYLNLDPLTFPTARAACRLLDPARVHLVVYDAPFEPDDVFGLIARTSVPDGSFFFVGAVQSGSATKPADDWFWISKLPVDSAAWASNEPQDGNTASISETHFEDVTAVRKRVSVGLYDVPLGMQQRSVCECDGVAEEP